MSQYICMPESLTSPNNLSNDLSGVHSSGLQHTRWPQGGNDSGEVYMTCQTHACHVADVAVHACRRRHNEAVPCYEAALAHQPSNAKTWFRLGISLFAIRRFQEAERAYKLAMQARSLAQPPPINKDRLSIDNHHSCLHRG